MNTTHAPGRAARARGALSAPGPSLRLQAALAAGTHPDRAFLIALVERCAV